MIHIELPANNLTYSALARLFSNLAGDTSEQGITTAADSAEPEETTAALVFSERTPLSPEGIDGSTPMSLSEATGEGDYFLREVPISTRPPEAPEPVALDVNGLPWDARIHAASRGQVSGGTWRYKKGVDKDLVPQVEAELRATMTVPVPTTLAPAATAGLAEPVAPTTFPELTQRVTASMVPKETLDTALASVGLGSFALLATRPDLVPAVEAALFPNEV